MKLDDFIHHLHFSPDKIRPPDWEVDWEHAPLPYKLYRDRPTFPLCSEIPLQVKKTAHVKTPTIETIGHLLWYVYGVTHVCQTVLPASSEPTTIEYTAYKRRFVPSGGALYPNELYLYLNIADLPIGIYHYDVAHHCLVLIREGAVTSYIDQALGKQYAHGFATIFITTRFEKNFFKYHNFSYRLQALDAGVILGQLNEVAKRSGFMATVYFQFLDQAVNHLLGLTTEEESTYAIIPLSTTTLANPNTLPVIDDRSLCKNIPALPPYPTHKTAKQWSYPQITALNEAASIHTTQSFRYYNDKRRSPKSDNPLPLPNVHSFSFDWLTVCQQRYSPGMDFMLQEMTKEQLARLLHEATATLAYTNDLDHQRNTTNARLSIYCCLYRVQEIKNGAYYYDPLDHALHPIRQGDHRSTLQQSLSVYNLNLYQVPVCLHVVGDRHHLQAIWGYRGYRIQQMEAGLLVQRLLLTATALGLGGHPLLGFDSHSCDELYRLDELSQTCLIQIPIGTARQYTRLTGGLHG